MMFPWPNPPSEGTDSGPGRLVRHVHTNHRWLRPITADCNRLANDLAFDWAKAECPVKRAEIARQYKRQRNEIATDWMKLTTFETAIHASLIFVGSQAFQVSATASRTIQEYPWLVVGAIALVVVLRKQKHRK